MDERKLTPRAEFNNALAAHAPDFGVCLEEEVRARLANYFELVAAWNPRLHLVAPCAPAEFAVRHVLESLLALRFMSEGVNFVDVGSGAGLPAIPCLIARPGLRAALFEASQRKAVFLREALGRLGLRDVARVNATRFEEAEPPAADYLTCRAIERFGEILERLAGWAPAGCTLLLFAGEGLRESVGRLDPSHESVLVPGSERRYLYKVNPPRDRSVTA